MAGLLDGYQFDPQAYGGGGGMGLLGLLAQQYGLPFPAQAPQGFAAPKGDYLGSAAGYAPTDYAPQGPPAPPLGTPIDVPSLQVAGAPNAQIPAGAYAQAVPDAGGLTQQTAPQNPLAGLLGGIGGGLSNLFSGGASPAGPAPGAGQQPGIPAQAAAGPGIGDRFGAGWRSFEQPGGSVTDAISGLITGQRQDPQGLLERALVARGVDPQMAHAGVKNPQLLPTLLQELPQQATTSALTAALVKSGRYSPEEAKGIATAVALNPALAPAILPQAFGAKYEAKTVKDLVGEHIEAFDPITGTTKSPTGGGGAGDGVGGPTVLAPGVKKYDPYLGADEYMAQFSPDMQSAIKMQIKGDAMPTGNPRLQGLWPTAKGFAALYADKAGIPFSDAIYNAKRVMRTGLAQSSNTSIGGILANGDSSFKHLGELGESFADLGNYAGPNIPGGAYIGEAGNVVGNTMFPTPKIRGKIAAIADNSLRFGQEATKFYAGSGGGEAERLLALKTVGGPGTNAEVQAAFLAKEKSLMLDRLNSKLQDVRQTLGDDEAQKIIADKMPSLNNSVAKIDAAIAKLRGEPAPQQGTESQQQGVAPGQQQAAPTGPAIKTKAEFEKLPSGATYIDARDGKPYRKP